MADDDVPLLTAINTFASRLIADAEGDGDSRKPEPVTTRVAVLKAVTAFLAVKNKLEPDPQPEAEESPVAQFQRELAAATAAATNGRAARRKGAAAAEASETLPGR